MKKDLLIVPTYIAVMLLLAFSLAVFFVLYPTSVPTIDYATYAVDVLLYAGISLLPLVSVMALTAILLRAIKIASFTTLELLIYIFLCLVVWLILIPICLFLKPEQAVSFLVTGNNTSSAMVFFTPGFFPLLVQNLSLYSVKISPILLAIFSDLLLLRDTAILAGTLSRFEYLLFASMGVALSSLYFLRSISKWKLINVAVILFLWCSILLVNVQLYKYEVTFFFTTKWLAFLFNAITTLVLALIGTVSFSAARKSQKGEAV